MRIKKSDWHYKIYKFITPENKWSDAPSVCEYWASVTVKPIVFGALCIISSPLVLFIWIASKFPKKIQKRSFCPFGKVEIES